VVDLVDSKSLQRLAPEEDILEHVDRVAVGRKDLAQAEELRHKELRLESCLGSVDMPLVGMGLEYGRERNGMADRRPVVRGLQGPVLVLLRREESSRVLRDQWVGESQRRGEFRRKWEREGRAKRLWWVDKEMARLLKKGREMVRPLKEHRYREQLGQEIEFV
jgi:hypothetical protein